MARRLLIFLTSGTAIAAGMPSLSAPVTIAAYPPKNAIVLVASKTMLERAAPEARTCGLDNVSVVRFSTGFALIADPKSRTRANMTCLYPRLKEQGWPRVRL